MNFPKLNILVVESNRFLASILYQTLSPEFNISLVSNGIEAMEVLDSGLGIDFIITDLKLPEYGGLELIQLVRNSIRYQTLPILVLSNSGESAARISCLDNGADDCMTKPFNPLEVRAKIRAMLRRSGSTFPRFAAENNVLFSKSLSA